jgi:hypothetical protein
MASTLELKVEFGGDFVPSPQPSPQGGEDWSAQRGQAPVVLEVSERGDLLALLLVEP